MGGCGAILAGVVVAFTDCVHEVCFKFQDRVTNERQKMAVKRSVENSDPCHGHRAQDLMPWEFESCLLPQLRNGHWVQSSVKRRLKLFVSFQFLFIIEDVITWTGMYLFFSLQWARNSCCWLFSPSSHFHTFILFCLAQDLVAGTRPLTFCFIFHIPRRRCAIRSGSNRRRATATPLIEPPKSAAQQGQVVCNVAHCSMQPR
jgi:hypothetical protein